MNKLAIEYLESDRASKEIEQRSEHPFVTSVLSVYHSPMILVFFLEQASFCTLADYLNKKRHLEEAQAIKILACLVLGMGHIHTNTNCYGEISLENVIVDEQGFPSLTNFFIQRIKLLDPQLLPTKDISYLSPEYLSEKKVTQSLDWWSLGVVFYQLLYGFHPFMSNSKQELARKIHKSQIVYPEKYSISADGKSLLSSLLAKDPKDRIGS